MFQNDYLMRMIMQFVQALQRALQQQKDDPLLAAESVEDMIGEALEIDPQLFLSMTGESMVSYLQLGDLDYTLGGFLVRSLYYESDLLAGMGQARLASLRRSQADAVAKAYQLPVVPADAQPDTLAAWLEDPLASASDSPDNP